MMYPKEEVEDGENILVYFCKNNCKKEIAEEWCVYRNDFKSKIKDDIPNDIVEDVTLQRITQKCPLCHNTTQSVCVLPRTDRNGDDNMKPFLYCTQCRNTN